MGWAEKEVKRIKSGKRVSWLEKRILEHANTLHLILAVIGALIILYGAWEHSWLWICTGLVLNLVGHVYCWTQK